MTKILAIARYTLVGNVRNRIFLVLILFGILLLGASFLFAILGQEQEIRMLTDLGLAAIEVLALIMSVFLMVNLILEEMETRTIYLVLTRSVGRLEYLLGKFAGTLAAIFACMFLMVLLHMALLWFKGWDFQSDALIYFSSVLMSFEKIILISALALFFSLVASSNVVALTLTFFVWVLGHFAMEMKFLLGQIEGDVIRLTLKGIYFIIPNFQYLNARDMWIVVSDRLPRTLMEGTVYTFVYAAASLCLALAVFRKKEF